MVLFILFTEKLDIQYSRSGGPGGQHVNKGKKYMYIWARNGKDCRHIPVMMIRSWSSCTPTQFCQCLSFCIACVAWQTHRDHVVHPWRRWHHRHTFCFRSITFEGMHWFHSNFAEHYLTIKYKSSLILIIIRQILAVMALFRLSFVVRFHTITFEGIHWFHSNFAEPYITVK